MASFSLIKALLESDVQGHERATQSAFLRNAARGKVSKDVLGQWLANDRLYINGYIQGLGRLLGFLPLPDTVPARETPVTRLLSWIIDALVNIRREERFFVDTAASYGIGVNLETDAGGRVPAEAKLEGLRRFEKIFGEVGAPAFSSGGGSGDGGGGGGGGGGAVSWLEGAVVFYGTEKCYLDAWTYARDRLKQPAHAAAGADEEEDGAGDEDGGALRKEFIPNWTGPEFVKFVDDLGRIIDDAVREQVGLHGEEVRGDLMERALGKWRDVLAAEEAFWPPMDE